MCRVVVTGMGVITPVGNDVDTFWNNITKGVCGIDHIKRFWIKLLSSYKKVICLYLRSL